MIPRTKAYIFAARRRNDDGEKISERGVNYEGKIKGYIATLGTTAVSDGVSSVCYVAISHLRCSILLELEKINPHTYPSSVKDSVRTSKPRSDSIRSGI